MSIPAAMAEVHQSPRAGIIRKPLVHAPATAPRVFAA